MWSVFIIQQLIFFHAQKICCILIKVSLLVATRGTYQIVFPVFLIDSGPEDMPDECSVESTGAGFCDLCSKKKKVQFVQQQNKNAEIQYRTVK